MTSATERLKSLLTAPDKRAAILEMASRNEIDAALISLLQQNIAGAKAAGQARHGSMPWEQLLALSAFQHAHESRSSFLRVQIRRFELIVLVCRPRRPSSCSRSRTQP